MQYSQQYILLCWLSATQVYKALRNGVQPVAVKVLAVSNSGQDSCTL